MTWGELDAARALRRVGVITNATRVVIAIKSESPKSRFLRDVKYDIHMIPTPGTLSAVSV